MNFNFQVWLSVYNQIQNTEIKLVKLHKYREVFKEFFNISFHKARHETCQECDLIDAQIRSPDINSEAQNPLITSSS